MSASFLRLSAAPKSANAICQLDETVPGFCGGSKPGKDYECTGRVFRENSISFQRKNLLIVSNRGAQNRFHKLFV